MSDGRSRRQKIQDDWRALKRSWPQQLWFLFYLLTLPLSDYLRGKFHLSFWAEFGVDVAVGITAVAMFALAIRWWPTVRRLARTKSQ
jgi:hypothetical protein